MADFRVILDSVDAANFDPVLDELLLQFPLERPNAEQVLRQAPVVLLDQLNAEEADNVRTNLVKLTRLGAKIRVTTAPAGTLKRLTWPVIPALARRAGSVFICPHCGEQFAVQAWNAPETAETARPQAAAAPAPSKPPQSPLAEDVPVVAAVTPVVAESAEDVPVVAPEPPTVAPAKAATPRAKAAPSKPVSGPSRGEAPPRVSERPRPSGKGRERAAGLVARSSSDDAGRGERSKKRRRPQSSAALRKSIPLLVGAGGVILVVVLAIIFSRSGPEETPPGRGGATEPTVVVPPKKEPAKGPAEQPAEGPAERPAEGPAEQPAEGPAEQPAEEPSEQPPKEPAKQPPKEAATGLVVHPIQPIRGQPGSPGQTPQIARMSQLQLRKCSDATIDLMIVIRRPDGLYASRGAGSIIHEDGYILTCQHLLSQGQQLLWLSDGSQHAFRVVGGRANYDLGIVKVDAGRKLPTVRLGRSNMVKIGDPIIGFGHPGIPGRDRHDVISGTIRRTHAGARDMGDGVVTPSQFEVQGADVLPGHSGGPIFNRRGELLGMVQIKNTAFPGLSYSLQIDFLRKGFAELLADREKTHRIGLTVDCYTDEAKVTAVTPGSRAEKAGLKAGDVIRQAGSMRIENGIHYCLALLDRRGIDRLEYERGGRRFTAKLR